jgi:flagellar biosynthesis protein FliR
VAALSTEGLTQIFLAALQVAGPLAVVLFLADVGLGLLTRVAPALNAFALGFPLKILMTLALVGTAYIALPQLVSALTDDAMRSLMEAVR